MPAALPSLALWLAFGRRHLRYLAVMAVPVAMTFLYLATVRAGAVFLPLNTGYTPAEIDYFIGDATPAILVSDPARADPVNASG